MNSVSDLHNTSSTGIASNQGTPVVHDTESPSGAAFSRISARIDGADIPLIDLEPKTSVMDRVKNIIGKNRSAYSHA